MNADPRLSELLCAEEVAAILGVTAKTVHAYSCRGQMPRPALHKGRTPLWDEDTIKTWAASRRRSR